MVYRPHVEDTLAFAEGRLAVVSRECSPEMSRYDAWHGMNDAMAAMAAVCGEGLGVYIHRKGARAAAPVWERRQSSPFSGNWLSRPFDGKIAPHLGQVALP